MRGTKPEVVLLADAVIEGRLLRPGFFAKMLGPVAEVAGAQNDQAWTPPN